MTNNQAQTTLTIAEWRKAKKELSLQHDEIMDQVEAGLLTEAEGEVEIKAYMKALNDLGKRVR